MTSRVRANVCTLLHGMIFKICIAELDSIWELNAKFREYGQTRAKIFDRL